MAQPAHTSPITQSIYLANSCEIIEGQPVHSYHQTPVEECLEIYDINSKTEEDSESSLNVTTASLVIRYLDKNFQAKDLSSSNLKTKTIEQLTELFLNEDHKTSFLFCQQCKNLVLVQYSKQEN